MLKFSKILISVVLLLVLTACEDDYFPMPYVDGLVIVVPYQKTFDPSITHNGITYGFVKSPYTEKIWLDRNLGASRACESFDDIYCYGDYYQWGRDADGHESNSINTTAIQADNVNNVGHGNFIRSSDTYEYDWAVQADYNGSLRQANWLKIDGSSVCPTDFRVPTLDELKAELFDEGSAQITSNTDAFNSFLKLPSAGYLSGITHGIFDMNEVGNVWTSSVDGVYSFYTYFGSFAGTYIKYRAHGLSVRCIQK